MEIKIVKGDITTIKVDAIVNAANKSLLGGGGVDGAIHRAAGKKLLEECKTLGGCKTGQAKITGGYRLPCNYVIHTVGPIWHGGDQNEEKLLQQCYSHSLRLAEENQCDSISFPAISTGVYDFPLQQATKIAIDTITDFEGKAQSLKEVIFVCFDDNTYEMYLKEKSRISILKSAPDKQDNSDRKSLLSSINSIFSFLFKKNN